MNPEVLSALIMGTVPLLMGVFTLLAVWEKRRNAHRELVRELTRELDPWTDAVAHALAPEPPSPRRHPRVPTGHAGWWTVPGWGDWTVCPELAKAVAAEFDRIDPLDYATDEAWITDMLDAERELVAAINAPLRHVSVLPSRCGCSDCNHNGNVQACRHLGSTW